MSAREAACPSCGAPLEFRNAASLVVCDSCRTAVYRSDVDVESLGKVPDVAPIDSVLSLGASGRTGDRAWHALGQVQLDHGAGPWNEWLLQFDDGGQAWLAEAQGELILTEEAEAPPDVRPDGLSPGAELSIGGERLVVAEVRRATVVAVDGELPGRTLPGVRRVYADLRGRGGRFATVSDDTGGAGPVEAFVGRAVAVGELGIDERTVRRPEPRRAPTDRLACPSCGAPIALRDPDGVVTLTCGGCATLLDKRTAGLRVVQALGKLPKSEVPLGSRARLRGLAVEVIAHLVRSVQVGGERYPWDEYLLRTSGGEYRWLVQAKGHWSFVEPADPASIHAFAGTATCDGRRYRHFQGGKARVDHVLGEMYWRCRVGETVHSVDYVSLDKTTGEVAQLSHEWDEDESTWSRAHHLPVDDLRLAFQDRVDLRAPRGISINQPNRAVPVSRALWRACVVLAAAAVALWILVALHHDSRVVLEQELAAYGEAGPGAGPEFEARNVTFSDEFSLEPAHANVVVRLRAEVDNAWVGVSGALVEVATGEVREFALEAERWHGVEDGESWSEGSDTATVRIGSVPAGRYAMRLQSSASKPGSALRDGISCRVTVRSQVPSTGRALWLLAFLAAPPAIASFVAQAFERKRWEESDSGSGGAS